MFEATIAYALPLISNASMPCAPPSASNPLPGAREASNAEPAILSVPLSSMRISWTASALSEATAAYAPPFISNAATSNAWSSASNPLPCTAEPAATSARTVSIVIDLEAPSEPGAPGAGSVRLAALPAASAMPPPDRRAPAPA